MFERKSLAAAAVLMAVLFGVGAVPSVSNAAETGISILPAQVERRIDPGQTTTDGLTVRNLSASVQTFYPGAMDIESMDEDGKPIYAPADLEKSGGELSSWISYSASSFTLAPGESANIGVTITVPVSAPLGSHAALAYFSTQPVEGDPDDSFIALAYTTGALVNVRVGDDGGDAAIIREFKAASKISATSAATLRTLVENTGTALVRPFGEITITDAFGRFTSSVSFNSTGGAILPGATRKYETQWTGDGLMMGRYTANLAATYGDTQKGTLIASASFWILPVRPLLIALGAGLIAFVIVYFLVRRTIRRSLKAAGVSADGARGAGIWAAVVAALVIVALAIALAFLLL